MKTIFQVRFLLITIGLLLFALYVQQHPPGRVSFSDSIGGPVEIARPANYYSSWLLLLLRFLVSGLVVPSVVGLLVCAVLRWRHPAYQIAIMRPVVLSVLVYCAWGLLTVFIYQMMPSLFNQNLIFQWVSVLTSIGWVIAAARFSYYQERTSLLLVEGKEDGGLPSSGLPVQEPE